jgi:hypothetical protein
MTKASSLISRCQSQGWTLTTEAITPTSRPRPLSGPLWRLRSKRLYRFNLHLRGISRRGTMFGGESHVMSFVIISHFRVRTFDPVVPSSGGMPGKLNSQPLLPRTRHSDQSWYAIPLFIHWWVTHVSFQALLSLSNAFSPGGPTPFPSERRV